MKSYGLFSYLCSKNSSNDLAQLKSYFNVVHCRNIVDTAGYRVSPDKDLILALKMYFISICSPSSRTNKVINKMFKLHKTSQYV